jgi:tetratricopeptide (TPR) repeat protein
MNDAFTSYETRLGLLFERLGENHPRYAEALTLQARLLENIAQARQYGDAEVHRAERAQIVDALNRLVLAEVGVSFIELGRVGKRVSDVDSRAKAVTTIDGAVYGPVHTGSGDIHINLHLLELLAQARRIQNADGRAKALIELVPHLPDLRRHEVLREALTAAREIRDPGVRSETLTALLPHLSEAARAASSRGSEAAAWGNLGLAYTDQGDVNRAIECYQRQLAIMRETGDRRGEATALGNLGNAYADLGDASRAIGNYEQVLAIFREMGDRKATGEAQSNLGLVYAALGDLRRAIEYYEQALSIAHRLNDRYAEAVRLQNLGLAHLRLADAEPNLHRSHLSRAAESLRQAMVLSDDLNAPPLQRGRSRYHLGRCYHRLGRWREAITFLEEARETFSRYKARPELAHTLLELGQLYHQRQDFESAYIYLKDALRLFRRLKDTDGVSVTQEALGSLALQTARLSQAIASLQEARQGYVALRRSERVRAVDDLLQIAHQARQPMGGATP